MMAKKLESELRCGICKDFFKFPKLLHCGHSICEECGKNKIEKIIMMKRSMTLNSNSNISTFQSNKGQMVSNNESEHDSVSESDSGIFLSNSSDTSLISDGALPTSITQAGCAIQLSNNSQFQLHCPICNLISIMPPNISSIDHFPDNFTLQSILNRYQQQSSTEASNRSVPVSVKNCQLCDELSPKIASVRCQQCDILYCVECRTMCHPMRGPLEKHSFVNTIDEDSEPVTKSQSCKHHVGETYEYFCEECGVLICLQCKSSLHFRHPIVPITIQAKKGKVTLSKCLQQISEKVISGTEFIQNLKSDMFKTEYDQFNKDIDATFDSIIEMIEAKRKEAHQRAKVEVERKERIVKDQMNEGAAKISETTSMIHLAVEVIKESNLTDFCVISDQIIKRVIRAEKNFLQELYDLKPKCNKKIELKLDTTDLERDIGKLGFQSFKCPESPKFLTEKCSSWDNLIAVVWSPQGSVDVETFLLDIDDGAGGQFKTAYNGQECKCTIENLHFGTNYRLRIRAANKAGISYHCDVIQLMTSSTSSFRMMPPIGLKKTGVNLSISGMVIESQNTNSEELVFLGNTGFSRGIHYWEYKIDHYDGIGEPSFGVALENCAKNKRLGSDMFSWGMYMNSKRSWFQHNSEHSDRTDVQISQGSKIGIRLDLDRQRLSYFVNNQPHGPIAFSQLLVPSSRSYNQLMNSPMNCGSSHSLTDSVGNSGSRSRMLYPAVSVSHGIRISLVSGLSPPADDSGSDGDDEFDGATQCEKTTSTAATNLLENVSKSSNEVML